LYNQLNQTVAYYDTFRAYYQTQVDAEQNEYDSSKFHETAGTVICIASYTGGAILIIKAAFQFFDQKYPKWARHVDIKSTRNADIQVSYNYKWGGAQ
jgi:hypothetical protein